MRFENPDFAVLNGDLVSAEDIARGDAGAYIDRIIYPLVAKGVAWGSTYGNHDEYIHTSRQELLAQERARGGALSFTRSDIGGPDAGVTNCYVTIFVNANTFPAAVLWFFDSRGGDKYREDPSAAKEPRPNWVDKTVADWYRAKAAELAAQYGKLVPSIAFVHQPPMAFSGKPKSNADAARAPGIGDDVEMQVQSSGWRRCGRVGWFRVWG